MTVMAVRTFERFFRVAGELDVDKSDLNRCDGFISERIVDLLIIGAARARADGRDVIEPTDLPITKGLQETIHRFQQLDQDFGMEVSLERIAAVPQLGSEVGEETRGRLPDVAGGLAMALAQAFRILDPEVRNPSSRHWERAFRLFELLL
jgi:hypothetical protein